MSKLLVHQVFLSRSSEHRRQESRARSMRHKTLRVPTDLADEITRRARIKGVPDADYYRLLIERGLLLESVELAMERPIPPAYWGLCEAVLETRNILRSLAAAREHSTIPKAQVQAKDELERMKSNGAQ
jgi:hypothetical protein